MHLFVEKLVNIDFSYLDVTRGLVGETWWASTSLEGALDQQGMVCDFGTVKKFCASGSTVRLITACWFRLRQQA